METVLDNIVDIQPVDTDHPERWCIEHDECWCTTCGFLCRFIHFEGKIVVWPERDGTEILEIAAMVRRAKPASIDVKIIEYVPDYGPFIPYRKLP